MSLELGPAAVSQRKLHHETPSHPASGVVSERFTPAPGIPGGSGGSFTWRWWRPASSLDVGIAGGASGAIATGTVKGAALGAGEALAFAGVHELKTGLGFPEAAATIGLRCPVHSTFLALENSVASPVGVEPDGSPRLILFSLRRSALFVLSVMSKWEDMLAEFRALGGIAENLCLKNGAFGRGLFPLDPSKPYKLHIPASLLIDIDHVEFENDVFRVGPKAQIGERASSFLEGYERDFSWGVANQEVRDLLQMLYEAPQEIRELMRSPFNAGSWLIEPTHPTAVPMRYLASRALTFKPGIDVVIPIVELANHGHTMGYEVDENGVGLKGKTDGEILVTYHPDDPLGMFVGWGFVSENEPFACSLSLGVDKKRLRIMRKEVNLELRPRPFMPDVTREGDTLILSFLMLGNRNNPALPRAIFYDIMREAGRTDAVEMFDYIQHVNRLQWLKLMKASESAAVPLGQLLRNLARSQLETMSYERSP